MSGGLSFNNWHIGKSCVKYYGVWSFDALTPAEFWTAGPAMVIPKAARALHVLIALNMVLISILQILGSYNVQNSLPSPLKKPFEARIKASMPTGRAVILGL